MDNITHGAPPETFGSNQTKAGKLKNSRIEVIATAQDQVNLTEPSSPTHAEYPYNKADRSISGHVREVDDTPGAERIFEMHKSGTFYEIHPDGTKVTKVFGKDFVIILDDDNLVIGGTRNITIQGDCNMLVKGNVKQKIGGNLETIVTGDHITRVGGKTIHYGKGDIDLQSRQNIRTRAKLKTEIHSISDVTIQSKANIGVQSDAKTNIHAKTELNLQASGNLITKSGGLTKIFAQGSMFLDASLIELNLPSGAPSTNIQPNNDPKDKDPTYGLSIPDSLFEPLVDVIISNKSDNTSIQASVQQDTSTYPKNRTKID